MFFVEQAVDCVAPAFTRLASRTPTAPRRQCVHPHTLAIVWMSGRECPWCTCGQNGCQFEVLDAAASKLRRQRHGRFALVLQGERCKSVQYGPKQRTLLHICTAFEKSYKKSTLLQSQPASRAPTWLGVEQREEK